MAHIFIENFASKVNFEDVKDMTIRTSGKLIGKFAFNQLATANMGYIFSKQIIPRLVSGVTVGSILTAGASISRSVYTSRDLRARNSRMYDQLRRLGNLDLLYFLLENKVRPFEDAVSVWERDRKKFNQICQYFFQRLTYEELYAGGFIQNYSGHRVWSDSPLAIGHCRFVFYSDDHFKYLWVATSIAGVFLGYVIFRFAVKKCTMKVLSERCNLN